MSDPQTRKEMLVVELLNRSHSDEVLAIIEAVLSGEYKKYEPYSGCVVESWIVTPTMDTPCPTCYGEGVIVRGYVEDGVTTITEIPPCPECGGTGDVPSANPDSRCVTGEGVYSARLQCPTCGGSGKTVKGDIGGLAYEGSCPHCKGKGEK
jgi:DnaJ-class molecular chaperone